MNLRGLLVLILVVLGLVGALDYFLFQDSLLEGSGSSAATIFVLPGE